MLIATHWIPTIAINQPQTIPAVPAYPIPYHSVVAIEGSSPSTENETPKEVNIENSRRNSCLYLYVCVIGVSMLWCEGTIAAKKESEKSSQCLCKALRLDRMPDPVEALLLPLTVKRIKEDSKEVDICVIFFAREE